MYALWIAPLTFPDYKAAPIPGLPGFVSVAVLAGIIWFFAILDGGDWRYFGERIGLDIDAEPSIVTRATIHMSRVIALYALVTLSIALLTWSTLPSGGTLTSPFSGALVAIALLSPFIAVGWVAPLVAFALVVVAYWIGSGIPFPVERVGYSVPDSLVLISVIVTNGIAIVIAVLVKRGERRRIERQRSAAVEGAVADLCASRDYAATHAAIAAIRPVEDMSAPQARRVIRAGIENLQIYNIGVDDDVRAFYMAVLGRREVRLTDGEQQHFKARYGLMPGPPNGGLRAAYRRYLATFATESESTATS